MSLDDYLSSETLALIEYLIWGICFLGGVTISFLGAVFISKNRCSRLLGSTVLVRGIIIALSFAYTLFINILSRTAGEGVVSAFANINSALNSLLGITYMALLLAFCRKIMRCKVWVIPVEIVLSFVEYVANVRTFAFWWQIQSDITHGKEIRDGVILPCIIWFAVTMAVLIAVNVIIIVILRKGRGILPQYSKISTFCIVFLCVTIVSKLLPFATVFNTIVYEILYIVIALVSIAVWIAYGVYLIRQANVTAADVSGN